MRQRFLVLFLLLLTACAGGTQTDNTSQPATQESPVIEVTATSAPAPEAQATEAPASPAATETIEPSPSAPPTEGAEPTAATEAEVTPATSEEPTATAEAEPTPEASAPFDPAAISVALEPVNSNFAEPLVVTHAGDGSGRLFVAEKGGRIWVLEGSEALPTPFLDISGSVSTDYEQGLLGLTFEPGRPERFYINYTNLQGNTVIARYRTSSDPNVADPVSAEAILTIEQPAANHNGGHLIFGPDGYLWIGMGDGGAAGDRFGNGQNPDTLLGAMLRIDVSGETGYEVPADNPFASGEGGAPAVWAIGLRNPWRYSFDRETGDLWLADVGQNAWEEVNHVPSDAPGLNFGWPIIESAHCFSEQNCSTEGLVVPVTEYSRDLGISITGGYVYRGSEFPELQGGYFFADFGSGIVWAIPADAEALMEPTIVLESGVNISSFGEDEAGELYVTAFDGTLYRLVSQ